MKTRACSTNRSRVFVSAFVFAAFLWTLALSVSPQLHSQIHSDAGGVEHTCAATFVATGNYEHATHPPLVMSPRPIAPLSRIALLNPAWIPSPFLGASIFEHAPPALP